MFSIEGNIVNIDGQRRARVEIDQESGVVVKVSEPTGKADVVLKEELIFPGFVDLHVHARECADHSQDYKEDFKSAGEAAINGGVVAYADMPNNTTPPVDEESYETKNTLAEKSAVEVVLYAGIGPNTNPLSKKVPYKVFMGHSVGDLFFTSREELEAVIKKYKGENVSFHCEDPKIMEEHKNAPTHEEKRPKEAEISAVDLAIELIQKYKLSGKICHCSTFEGLEKIIKAKERGVKITVEVTPHHLYFNEKMAEDIGRIKFQVNPPIREGGENIGLIAYLKEGKIDYLATDHAPHSKEEKAKGISGLTHLDTYGPFITWLIKEHGFTPEEAARVCAYNPGNFINQFVSGKAKNGGVKYGEIKEGFVGSLTVIDLNKPTKITEEMLKTKSRWSPFFGVTFPGSVVVTVIKGQILKNEIKK